VISPFGLVRFRHFFLADVLTSLVQPLRDLGFIGCFFFQGGWKEHEMPSVEKCPILEDYILAIVFFPFWFRFAQCLRRYHDSKDKLNLANAGKYFSMILIHFSNIFKAKLRTDATLYIFISVSLISTLYAYSWDIYMDWGLLRCSWRERNKRLLRNKTLFPQWFYYYAALSNLLLRFTWTLSLMNGLWFKNTQVLLTFMTLGEGLRRA
jgi:glucan phosphoethanolaminetransferase (alkaline phosphatase superfamily)